MHHHVVAYIQSAMGYAVVAVVALVIVVIEIIWLRKNFKKF